MAADGGHFFVREQERYGFIYMLENSRIMIICIEGFQGELWSAKS